MNHEVGSLTFEGTKPHHGRFANFHHVNREFFLPDGLFEASPYTITWTLPMAYTPIIPLNHTTYKEF